MSDTKKNRSLGTHDGTFHADEASAAALLLLSDLIDRDKIVRTRDPHLLAQCEFVCDVGGEYDPERKLFDHHQVDYQGPLSSAGMVLAWLRDEGYLSEAEYQHFNHTVIIGVDDHDNGRAPQITGHCSFSHMISNMLPIAYNATDKERDAAFLEAVDFILGHFRRLRERFHYIRGSRLKVEEAMKKGRDCLIFDEGMPWLESFFELGGEEHPARFIIMPSGDHWKLRAIPPSYEDRMSCRQTLPKHWSGLLEGELEEVSGIPGAIFCHKGGFISVWETKEAALQALDYVLGCVSN